MQSGSKSMRFKRTYVIQLVALMIFVWLVFRAKSTGVDVDELRKSQSELSIKAKPKGTTLTHVVVPLYPAQIGKFDTTVRKFWLPHQPCDGTTPTPRLVLLLTRSPNEATDSASQLAKTALATFSAHPHLASCFQDISVCEIPLGDEENARINGARVVLERMLKGQCIFGERGYALLIEPDARPVKKHWLSTIAVATQHPREPFWLLGSIYRGTVNMEADRKLPYKPQRFHINGNAVYRVSGLDRYNEPDFRSIPDIDAGLQYSSNGVTVTMLPPTLTSMERPLGNTFADLYFNTVRPYAIRRRTKWAYDVYLFEYMFDDKNWQHFRLFAQKIQYTGLILNYYRTNWSTRQVNANPETRDAVIVHGGYPAELRTATAQDQQ